MEAKQTPARTSLTAAEPSTVVKESKLHFMRMARTALCGVLAVSCTASGRHDAGTSASADSGYAAISDGSHSLKLRLYNYSNPAANLRGSAVRIENGLPSFGLDGEGTYYVNGGWTNGSLDADLGWRYGTLPGDAMGELNEALRLSNLADLQDCVSNSGLFDVTPWIISSSESSAGCVSPGPRMSKALGVISARGLSLWNNGAPMTGGMRVSAVSAASDGSRIYQWPLGTPLSDFTIKGSPSNEYSEFATGVSTLVSDPTDSARLRTLREQYLSDRTAAPGLFTDGQMMSDGRTTAFVYMRDALPYEDNRGLWPF